MEGQGDGHPLILADAAVVVGLEIGQLAVLIEGVGLQVQPGGVDVGRRQLNALVQGLFPDVGQHDGLAPVADVDLVPGFQEHAPAVGPVARLLRQADGLRRAEALGLAGVQKALVPGAVVLHGRPAGGVEDVVAVLLCGEELFFQLLEFRFFHGQIPPVNMGELPGVPHRVLYQENLVVGAAALGGLFL